MTVEEVAAVRGISRTSAYECVRRGELRAVRLGRRLVVPRIVVDQLLTGDRPNPPTSSVES
jgi:excisionase family DNA binding protein